MKDRHPGVDLSVLIDIMSNAAGMMVLVACIALVVKQEQLPKDDETMRTKPISFPMAYIPPKNSVTMCLKNGQLYFLPHDELLKACIEKTKDGKPMEWLSLEKDGVDGRLEVTRTLTGFRFLYALKEKGGVPLENAQAVVEGLRKMMQEHAKEKYFCVVHCWPDEWEYLREIREFLNEADYEVGWVPRLDDNDEQAFYDISYSIGEYGEHLSSIKAN